MKFLWFLHTFRDLNCCLNEEHICGVTFSLEHRWLDLRMPLAHVSVCYVTDHEKKCVCTVVPKLVIEEAPRQAGNACTLKRTRHVRTRKEKT